MFYNEQKKGIKTGTSKVSNIPLNIDNNGMSESVYLEITGSEESIEVTPAGAIAE